MMNEDVIKKRNVTEEELNQQYKYSELPENQHYVGLQITIERNHYYSHYGNTDYSSHEEKFQDKLSLFQLGNIGSYWKVSRILFFESVPKITIESLKIVWKQPSDAAITQEELYNEMQRAKESVKHTTEAYNEFVAKNLNYGKNCLKK